MSLLLDMSEQYTRGKIQIWLQTLALLLIIQNVHSKPGVIMKDRREGRTTEMPYFVEKLNTTRTRGIERSHINPTRSPLFRKENKISVTSIQLDKCREFTHKIPRPFFGNLNDLPRTELFDENSNPASDSTIRFNFARHEIYGLLTQKSYHKSIKLNQHFILRGKNSSGFKNEVHFDLKLPAFIRRWNYKVTVKLEILRCPERRKLDIALGVMKKISDYFSDRHSSMIFPIAYQVERNTITFQWSNHSFDYPSCSHDKIRSLSSKIFHSNGNIQELFRQVFSPEFRLIEASEKRTELCSPSFLATDNNSSDIEKAFLRSLGSVEIKTPRKRRSIMSNTAPILKGQIGVLNVSYCSLFLYEVPKELFVDNEDGNTRNLTLTLKNKDGTNLGQHSWVQLQSSLQTLYGYLKASDAVLADDNGLIHYTLTAIDSGGLTSTISFSVRIPASPPKIFYKVELTVNSFHNQSEANVDEEIFLSVKIVSYFEDSFFWGVNILSFERNFSSSRITFGWTNCTLTGEKCPEKAIETLIGKVVTQDGRPNSKFEQNLQPQYIIYKIKATRVGECAFNATSSTAVTATPIYSNSPQINMAFPELTVTTAEYFTYQIPPQLFYDSVDGYTRSLSLELRTSSSTSLSGSSWLQFDAKTQTIYGILTSIEFSTSFVKTFTYLLIATNSRGFSTELIISLKGYRQTVSFGAKFSISGRDNSEYTVNNVKVLAETLFKLRGYLPQTRNNSIEVEKFERILVGQQRLFTLVYSNTTITTSNCDALIPLLPMLESQGNLINPSLTVALTPSVVADRIDIQRLGQCAVTSSITPSPTIGNFYPELRNRIPLLNIQSGFYFYYQVSADTFYDATDGNTRGLSLMLTYSDGKSLNQSSWIQFDSVNQHIYGLISASQQTERPYQNFVFILSARNSLGYTAAQYIQIRSEYSANNIGVEFTLQGREYSTIQLNNVQLQNHIVAQLKQYLNITSNKTINVLSFNRQSTSGSLFSIKWTDSRLNSANCNLKLLRSLESAILSTQGVIHSNLIVALTPSIILYEARISYYGTCLMMASSVIVSPSPINNSPQYSNIIPVINATSGMFFRYQIPREAFIDNIDGDTRQLRLSLANIDGTSLGSTSLVRFNITDQIIYGLVSSELLHGVTERVFTYSLIATNSRNYQTVVAITIKVSRYIRSIGVSVITSTNVRYSTSTTDLRLMQYFVNKINIYFQHSVINNFIVRSFIRRTTPNHELVVTWSYSLIDGATCNQTELEILLRLLQNENGQPNQAFVASMSPEFGILGVAVQKHETCLSLNSRISTTGLVIESTYKPSTRTTVQDIQKPSVTVSIPIDQPPKVTSRLLPLFAYFCIPFSYTIPADLFHDDEQGNARNLKLRLEMHDGSPVNESSWLQLSQSSQAIYGILKMDDYYKKPKGGYMYYVTAVDNQGQTARTDFTITIPSFPPQLNHVIEMSFDRVFDKTVPYVNEQLLMVTKILNYFNDKNTNKINVISYEASTVGNTAKIKWSNCSLQYTPCPNAQLNVILNRMITGTGGIVQSFREAMTPYVLHFISVEKLGPCNQTAPATATSFLQSTISPSPSIGVRPYLQSPIPQINITWCAPFEFQIPSETFYDAIEGHTRNLSLQLLQINHSPIPEDSWLKFDNVTQTISGYLKQGDLSSFETASYILVATNRVRLSASQIVSIKVVKPKPNPNHQLAVTTTAYLNSKMADVDVRMFIYRRMKSYLQSNSEELIFFEGFTRGSDYPAQLHFTYSNCQIREDKCDTASLNSMLAKIFTSPGIINSEFIIAFAPEIVITAVKIEHLGLCTMFSSSFYSYPSTLYPQPISVASTQVTPAKNLPPLVLRAIGTLNVDVCAAFSFVIPETTFYDVEGGLTRRLNLSLTNINNTVLGIDSWVTFDQFSQTLHAVVIQNQIKTGNMEYLLKATDKGGLSVATKVSFKIQGDNKPVYSEINMTATGYYGPETSNNDILKEFVIKISTYLGFRQENSIRILSFARTTSDSKIFLSWTPCDTKYECNVTAWAELQRKLLVSPTIVNPDLVIALSPKIIVMKVEMENFASCSTSIGLKTTTVATMTAHRTPSLETAITSSFIASSSISITNTPPRFMRAIPVITASLCGPFSVQIPSDICYESEDGFTGTSITVTYKNGTALARESMLQYSQVNRTIYGIIKQSDLSANQQIKEEYAIKCMDTKGLATSERIIFNITNNKLNHTYSVTFYSYIYSISSQTDVDIQLLWMKKLRNYLQHPVANQMHFIYFTRLSEIQAKFAVQLCDLDVCNSTEALEIKQKTFSTIPLLNTEFVASMIPEFSLVSAEFAAPAINNCPNVHITTVASTLPITASSTTLLSSTAIYDSPPQVRRFIPIINVTLCAEFSYRIPDDTFYDPEQGYTSNLTTSFYDINGNPVNSRSWIQYDSVTLSLYGYLSQDSLVNSSVISYELRAVDRSGNSAKLFITLRSTTEYKKPSHSFMIEGNLHTSYRNDVRVKSYIALKLKTYYGTELNEGVMFVNFNRFDGSTPKVVFAWSACSLAEKCDRHAVRNISDKMLFSGTIINFEFIAALAPDFIVTKVRVAEDEACLVSPSSVSSFALATEQGYSSRFATKSRQSITFSTGIPNGYSTFSIPLLHTTVKTSYSSFIPTSAESATTSPIPSKQSTVFSSTTIITPPQNSPPIPATSITIKLTYCNIFRFKIPNETFIDKEDGDIRNLELRLLDRGSKQPNCNFTLMLNNTSKEIYGVVLTSQMESSISMLLEARDSQGLSSVTNVTFRPVEKPQSNPFNVTFTIKSKQQCQSQILLYLYNKLSLYFPAENLTFTSILPNYIDNSLKVSWTFCSSYNLPCNHTKISEVESKLLQDSRPRNRLSQLLLPEIVLLNVSVQTSRKCLPGSSMVFFNITYCSTFKHTLHDTILNGSLANTGLSSVDRSLRYELTGKEGQSISWVKFDSNTLSLVAHPVYSILQASNLTMMTLTIKRQSEILRNIEIQLHHPKENTLKQNLVIYLNIISYLPFNTKSYDLLDLILIKISTHMKVSKQDFLIIDFNRTKVYPETVSIALAPCFSEQKCNSTKARTMVRTLIQHTSYPTYTFVQSMIPEFVIQSVSETRKGPCVNRPPIKNKGSLNLTVSLCTELYSPVENKTFFDQEDNTSTGLAYKLLDKDGKELGFNSWVQFDSKKQIIYGVPTRTDLVNQPENGYLFILKAADSAGLSSNITVSITITGNIEKSVYETTLIFKSLSAKSTRNVDIILDLLSKIRRYFGELKAQFIGIISFTRAIDLNGMDSLVWTNCSLTNESCDISTIDSISKKLVTNNGTVTEGFINEMGSNYSISRIIEEKSGVCGNNTNTAPKINASIPTQEISACSHLQYQIPTETFIDKEDGNTRSLTLYLKTNLGHFLETSSWIQLDTTDQTIYGIATYDVIQNQPISGYSFVLHAQDSNGAVSKVPVVVRWYGNMTDRDLVNIVMNIKKDVSSTDLKKQRLFIAKSAQCLNMSEDSISIAYYNGIKGQQNYINMSVYSDCGNSKFNCSKNSESDLYRKLTTNYSDQRRDFIRCMEPEISVINITVLQATKCTRSRQNSPPTVNKTIPLLNMTLCQAMYYKIPNNTFMDKDNDRLTINLLQSDGKTLTDEDFVQFNQTSMLIYGFTTEEIAQAILTNPKYILQARDTYGATANVTIEVQIQSNVSDTRYKVCLSLTRYSQTKANQIEVMMDIMTKISYYLGDTSRDSLAANNFSIRGLYPQRVGLCFSNCSLERCDKMVIDSLKQRVFLRGQIIRPEFIRALAPQYVIHQATDYISEECKVSPTTTTTTTTTIAYTQVLSASLSTATTIVPTPVKFCGKNTKPKIINSVQTLFVEVSQPALFTIPNDIAYDAEDGGLERLGAELTDLQGQKITQSWIYLDDQNKTIYVSFLQADKEDQIQQYQFRLVVTDSCGASVYDIFKVQVVGEVSCCYSIETALNISYKELSSNVTLQYEIYRGIQLFYNDTQGIQLQSIRNNTGNYSASSILTFTNSSLTNASCLKEDIERFSDRVFFKNGTTRPGFFDAFAPFKVTHANGRYNKDCNATAIIIPPIIPVAPTATKVRTIEDWIWYIIPFIILAFLLVLCCLLFYWCTSCCEACRGGKKKKGFDPFSTLAARPLGEEAPLSKAAAAKAAEAAALKAAPADEAIDEQALAAAAAHPLESESSTDPPFEDMYAQIAPTASDQPVPSLHKDKKPKFSPWMAQAPKPLSEDSNDGPEGGVAALPNTDDSPNDDLTAGVAAMPREGPANEDPVNADVAPMFQRQPKYSTASTFSMFSSDSEAAPVPQSEDPMTMATAAMPQSADTAPTPVDEDTIRPTQRPGTQAAPPPRLLTEGRSEVTETITSFTTENRNQASGSLQPADAAPGVLSAPILRLPSRPAVGPNEPPPPYSPPKQRRTIRQIISHPGTINQQHSINRIHLTNQRAAPGSINRQFSSSQRIFRPVETVDPFLSPRAEPIVLRTVSPRQSRRKSRRKLVLVDEASPTVILRKSVNEALYQPRTTRLKDKRPSFILRRKSATPKRQRKEPIYLYTEELDRASNRHRSPPLSRQHHSPSRARRSKEYEIHKSDYDYDTVRDDSGELDTSGKLSSPYSDLDASDAAGKQVPIELKGVFKAPEKFLRKWFRESALASSLSPKTRQRESNRRAKSFKRIKENGSDYLNYDDAAGLGMRKSRRNHVVRQSEHDSNRGSFMRKRRQMEDGQYDNRTVTSKIATRNLKRGYPYSKDPYEYVETALKTRPKTVRGSTQKEKSYLDVSSLRSDNGYDDYDVYQVIHRTSPRRPRKNMEEIFARLSRRKELRNKRHLVMSNPNV